MARLRLRARGNDAGRSAPSACARPFPSGNLPPRHLGDVRTLLKALRRDPGLLLARPSSSPALPRDHLNPPIGITASKISQSVLIPGGNRSQRHVAPDQDHPSHCENNARRLAKVDARATRTPAAKLPGQACDKDAANAALERNHDNARK
jgi:hypothetical protein